VLVLVVVCVDNQSVDSGVDDGVHQMFSVNLLEGHVIVSNMFVLLAERNFNNICLNNDALDNSLVNSRGQESCNTCSMENVCSEVQTVHSQSDQSDVTILEKNDFNPEICEIVDSIEGNASELIRVAIKQDNIATCFTYSEGHTVKCDQSGVMIPKNIEHVKLAVNGVVVENEGDACELHPVHTKTTCLNEATEMYSNSPTSFYKETSDKNKKV